MPSTVPVARAISPMMRDPRFRRTTKLGQHFVGLRLQRVTRQNRNGFAKDLVAGGAAAAQVVVVERRQIIVDERVGVQHLERRA